MNAIVRERLAAREPTRPAPVPQTARDRGAYAGETYYRMQAVKPSPFDWRAGVYLFVSGLAGAAQLIAAIADRFGPNRMRTVVRNGRTLALSGAIVGPLLLIADLKTPRRWYNMLRIYRSTSPMSIGSYILTVFGAASSVTLIADRFRNTGKAARVARMVELPATAASAGMLTYTGALLSSTSTPLWAAEAPWLGARFAASGVASGAAALALAETLAGREENAAALDRLALGATATYALLSRKGHAQAEEAAVDAPLRTAPHGTLYRIGDALSVAIPLACHALNLIGGRRSRTLSVVAAASTLAGAAITRYAYLEAGKISAKRAEDYLRYTSTEKGA